jgi:hypothetical protein
MRYSQIKKNHEDKRRENEKKNMLNSQKFKISHGEILQFLRFRGLPASGGAQGDQGSGFTVQG